ncbi:hypothetical protein NLG97_g11302 [Lecanicillium saksenae]|uniref:Uncharacterized protein n=1 Tax=Lecanicillium saksenae TaxID=468837 RepID=A0ACC1QC66_9HYPO|nr:hypothetical protein NLG97_g11302 [Lecanicillium saksenae]
MLRECSSVGPRCPEHSPEEKAMFRNIAIDAKVFVEYQPDGSWTEVCAQRMFYAAGHAYSSEYIPMNERPDPELVRVHDTDVEFAPVVLEEESEEEWDV